MNIAITGASGFLGRELIRRFSCRGQSMRCWTRSPQAQSQNEDVQWVEGSLTDTASMKKLVRNRDVVIHAGLWRTTESFRGNEPDLVRYAQANVIGSLQLIREAMDAGVKKFIYVSSCAVHDRILDDRSLDEAHPTWASNHYGAHKAAVEQFVGSFGHGEGFDICAIRPSAIYGIDQPLQKSRWHELCKNICRGKPVSAEGGGKLVHVADVAQAIELLLKSDSTRGECYACCEGYFSNFDVAHRIASIAGSKSQILGSVSAAKHSIDVTKLKTIGMAYGGTEQLDETLRALIDKVNDFDSDCC